MQIFRKICCNRGFTLILRSISALGHVFDAISDMQLQQNSSTKAMEGRNNLKIPSENILMVGFLFLPLHQNSIAGREMYIAGRGMYIAGREMHIAGREMKK